MTVVQSSLSFPGAVDFFYGVPFYDAPTLLSVSGFLVLIAAIASAVPARRALRVDPMVALRHD